MLEGFEKGIYKTNVPLKYGVITKRSDVKENYYRVL